jgi:hypothetical protein
VLGVWIATAGFVFLSTRLHPSTVATAALSVSSVTFYTDAHEILGGSDQKQLIISGINLFEVHGSQVQMSMDGSEVIGSSFTLVGEPNASCSFSRVTTSNSFTLEQPHTVVTVGWIDTATEPSMSVKFHGAIGGELTSQPSIANNLSGFTCIGLHQQNSTVESVSGVFSEHGGDSISFRTAADARIDLLGLSSSSVGDTQLKVISPIRFSHVAPGSSEEKTVLLEPPNGRKNQITFKEPYKLISISPADLLVIQPDQNFYLSRFYAHSGIQLDLGGHVRDIKIGPGSADLATCMPTMFEHLKAQEVLWCTFASISAALFGMLEKLGILPGKKT